MPKRSDFEEERVQEAIRLLKENPTWKIPRAAKEARAIERRVRDRIKGVPPSLSRGGQNKKLMDVGDIALKRHIYMCYDIGRSASIDHIPALLSEIMLSNRLPKAIEWRWRCSSAVQGIYETELYIDGTDH
jgi:hypothetical protein